MAEVLINVFATGYERHPAPCPVFAGSTVPEVKRS